MNGWLILDKPLRMSSAQAVSKVKRFIPRGTKIGHAGTLDPLATGILPLAIGEATKTVGYAMDKDKRYTFTVTFGEARSTQDAEGEVTERTEKLPVKDEVLALLSSFIGEISQIPPMYSALKIDGKRAYELARAGEEVEMKARPVTIHGLEMLDFRGKEADFAVHCGKGTYVRSLARDIAEKAGSLGYVSALRRTAVGQFAEKDAISLENLEELVHKGAHATLLRPVDSVLDDILVQELTPPLVDKLHHGHTVPLEISGAKEGQLIRAKCGETLVALCIVTQGMMRPVRVFNLVPRA